MANTAISKTGYEKLNRLINHNSNKQQNNSKADIYNFNYL
nr:Putative uncharacterized protein [Moritella viscosa]